MPRSRYSKISRRPGVHLASLARLCTKSHVFAAIVSSIRSRSIDGHTAVDRKELPGRDGSFIGRQVDGHVSDVDWLAQPQQVAGGELADIGVGGEQPLHTLGQRD